MILFGILLFALGFGLCREAMKCVEDLSKINRSNILIGLVKLALKGVEFDVIES